MHRTHGKEFQLQINFAVYPQSNPNGSNTRPNPALLAPKPPLQGLRLVILVTADSTYTAAALEDAQWLLCSAM